MKARATYIVKNWKEEIHKEISPEMKITFAEVDFEMKGDIESLAHVDYLMFYKQFDVKDKHGADAVYTGIMNMEGKVQGKKGSFTLEDSGTFHDGQAESSLKIIEGSGTGDLATIKGVAKYH